MLALGGSPVDEPVVGSLSSESRDRIERRLAEYCRMRSPAELGGRARVAFRIDGLQVTLFEVRSMFLREGVWTETEVAQFRYRPSDRTWTLYWMDRHHEWNEYWDVDPTGDFEELLHEVDRDPTGIFWG
jgi:hypothetical protein